MKSPATANPSQTVRCCAETIRIPAVIIPDGDMRLVCSCERWPCPRDCLSVCLLCFMSLSRAIEHDDEVCLTLALADNVHPSGSSFRSKQSVSETLLGMIRLDG